jgi:hypothetical protein
MEIIQISWVWTWRAFLDIKVDAIYDNILDNVLLQTNVCERIF